MVSVIDIADNHFIFDEDDCTIEWFSGTGAGGQHRNKHQNCCRVIHRPSGLVETRQGRSRDSNRKQAMEALEKRLSTHHEDQVHSKSNVIQRTQMGSGMRGDKIRTYRFQDNQVTDHNSQKTADLKKVMKGNFDLLW